MRYNFYIEYKTGAQDRKESIIEAENALEAILLVVEHQKRYCSKEWEKNPTGMISVRARVPLNKRSNKND
jgi:hypothetical protein